MTITGADGAKVEIGAGATAKMPDYLPLYPGAKVTSSFTGQDKNSAGGVVTFHSDAAGADIIAFYKGKAKAAGMSDTMNMDSGGTMMYVGSNEQAKTHVQVTVTKASDGSGSDASVAWGSK
jgi:hypothetical protein